MSNRIKQSALALMGAMAIALAGLSAAGHYAYGQGADPGCPGRSPCSLVSRSTLNAHPDEMLVRWTENADRAYYRVGWVDMAKYREWETDPGGSEWLDLFSFRDIPTGSVFTYHDNAFPGNYRERALFLSDMDAETEYAVIVGGMDARFSGGADWSGWVYETTPPRPEPRDWLRLTQRERIMHLADGDAGRSFRLPSGGRSPHAYRIHCYDRVVLPPGIGFPPGSKVAGNNCTDLILDRDRDGYPLPFTGAVNAGGVLGVYDMTVTVTDSSVSRGYSRNLALMVGMTLCTGRLLHVGDDVSCVTWGGPLPTRTPTPAHTQ